MCGISAIIADRASLTISRIKSMTEMVKHRGPDDEGYAIFGNFTTKTFFDRNTIQEHRDILAAEHIPYEISGDVALGHRRLSIIDLSPNGHQPMSYKDSRYWITYNGEIYNYIELRDELQKLGHCFVSLTDTEVILAAFDEWGEDCLHHFNGMWAFIIYDLKDDVIFAARDRFGVKPLYYWQSAQGLSAFASEIKQFTVLPGWEAAADHQMLYDFLVFETADHTHSTLFRDVSQICGGESIFCKRTELVKCPIKQLVKKWYQLHTVEIPDSFTEASAIFRNIFIDAVKLRLRSDVPVGTGLSGGLDSSSIVCVTTDILREKDTNACTNAFSSCSHDPIFDEREFISEVIQKTRAKPHYSFPDPELLLKDISSSTWLYDEPVLSTSVFAEQMVFKQVAETPVKVTLDGHGADEVLAGYPGFFTPFARNLLLKLRFSNFISEIAAYSKNHRISPLLILSRIADISVPQHLRQRARSAFGQNNAFPSWLNAKAIGAIHSDPKFRLPFSPRTVDGMSKLLLLHTSLPVQLHWCDRDSMSNSVESRAPFLDYRVVEFLASCPDSFKIYNGRTKFILREAMKNILPEKIRNRQDKIGFVTAEENWMKQIPAFMELFKESVSIASTILTPEAEKKANAIISGTEKFNFFIWRIISFGAWIKTFNVRL